MNRDGVAGSTRYFQLVTSPLSLILDRKIHRSVDMLISYCGVSKNGTTVQSFAVLPFKDDVSVRLSKDLKQPTGQSNHHGW